MPAKKSLVANPPAPILVPSQCVADGFTQSEFSEMSCMQRWNYRYVQLLVKTGIVTPIALAVGTAFHGAMEQFYATKGKRVNVATLQFKDTDIPSLVDHQKLNFWNLMLPAMLEAYCIYYKGDDTRWELLELEREVDIVFRGIRLRGKIDLKVRDTSGLWIVDHKTTSRLNRDVVAGYDFRFQFMFYLWLESKINPKEKLKGFIVNTMKKPELRQKVSESVEAFVDRCRTDMISEPDKYFYREAYPITKDALEHFEQEVVIPKLNVLQFLIDHPESEVAQSLMKVKNTDECQKWGKQPCAYIDLCRHGDKMSFLFDKKPAKHEELGEGGEVEE